MARALYRTHRSRSLDEVIGQEHITNLLKQALHKGTISHAYLLTGPRGTGKTSVARILAHEINEIAYSDDQNLDIIEIDAASNRRIDDIRELRDKVRIAPVATKYKVYIIDEVHMLTTESFNALLKTLEEPPEHAIFILATTEVHKVPATILSRTQRFHFRPVAEDKVAAHLAHIAEKEKITISEDALRLIARHGGGSFRDSISLLDQLSASGEPVTKEGVESTLGLVASEQMDTLIETILAHKTKPLLAQLRAFNDDGVSPIVISEQLTRALSHRADEQPEIYQLLDQLLGVPRSHDPFIKLTATLVAFCESHKPRTVAARVTQPVVSAPVVPKTTLPTVAAKEPATSEAPSTPAPVNVTQPSGEFNWEGVLTSAKKHNAPLHSVLSRARIEFEDGKLTLYFVYALHRKKLEQSQYHAQLSRLIHDVCGVTPTIAIKDGKTMTEEASAVAAIMGGGEPVHA